MVFLVDMKARLIAKIEDFFRIDFNRGMILFCEEKRKDLLKTRQKIKSILTKDADCCTESDVAELKSMDMALEDGDILLRLEIDMLKFLGARSPAR